MIYKVAEVPFEIAANSTVWEALKNRYAPFKSSGTPKFRIEITSGAIDVACPSGFHTLYEEAPKEEGFMWTRLYADRRGNRLITFQPPQAQAPAVALRLTPKMRRVRIRIDEDNTSLSHWQLQSALTSAIMLVFSIASAKYDVLMTHSAAVVKDGRAYLFIGRSGTGKSTQARMWLRSFPDAFLLNDDHPVLRVGDVGSVTAYGSPWSGKTHCYKNLSAPLGGVVRIKQAPFNRITKQEPLVAYASLSTSFSGITWVAEVADMRHRLLEKLIGNVGCWQLECLPQPESAVLAWENVKED